MGDTKEQRHSKFGTCKNGAVQDKCRERDKYRELRDGRNTLQRSTDIVILTTNESSDSCICIGDPINGVLN